MLARTMMDGFLVVNNHFACGVHDESAHSLSRDKSEGWFYGAFIFTGLKSRSVAPDGFMAHSFSQDRNREALPPARRNGIFENAYLSL